MAIKVYDADGNEKDLLWAMEEYSVKILATPRDVDHWEVVELRENIGDAGVIVRLVGEDIDDIPIAFSWPEAPYESLPEEPKPVHVAQLSNEDGHTGFGMGGGAWYRKGECGPHSVWVAMYPVHTSDCVDCLGMRAPAVNHDHLDVTFSFVKGVESEPEPGCEDLREAAIKAIDILKAHL